MSHSFRGVGGLGPGGVHGGKEIDGSGRINQLPWDVHKGMGTDRLDQHCGGGAGKGGCYGTGRNPPPAAMLSETRYNASQEELLGTCTALWTCAIPYPSLGSGGALMSYSHQLFDGHHHSVSDWIQKVGQQPPSTLGPRLSPSGGASYGCAVGHGALYCCLHYSYVYGRVC